MYPRCFALVLGGWLAVTAICLSFAPARAATVFDLNGTFFDGSAVSGTLTIDTTAGVVDAANLSYLGNTYSTILTLPPLGQGPFSGVTAPGQTPVPVGYGVDIGTSAAALPRIDILIPGTSVVDSLVSYVGGPLCSFDAECGPDQQLNTYLSAFHSTSCAVVGLETGALTPLPAALPLFAPGLGAMGLIGWRRKRKAQAVA
jgi:hypothetical protein